MSLTLTVSFHGGSSGHKNLHTYPGGAKLLPEGSGDPPLTKAELRGFTLGAGGDSHLYVIDGYKDASQILQYAPSGTGYGSGKVWATSHLHHPFDAAWGPGGYLYVSNQDPSSDKKIHITAFDSSGAYVGDFADGFIELRGIAWAGNTLWVADEKGGPKQTGALISYAYNSNTKSWPVSAGATIAVTDPVHVIYDGSRYIYIGSEKNNAVLAYDTTQPSKAPVAVVTSSSSAPIDATAGIAIATDGGTQYMFVCSRKGDAINQYQLNVSSYPPSVSNASVFASKLGDNPEFAGVIANGVFN
jgi:hypothetical protein